MTDDAYERLAQRNAELEAEKTALAEELEHTQGERDAAIRRAEVAEDGRDVLSSYVEQLHAKIDECYGDPARMHLEVGDIRDRGPITSLARRDMEQQAMGMDSLIPMVADGIGRALDLSEDQIIEVEEWLGGHAELRRQAEADTAGEES